MGCVRFFKFGALQDENRHGDFFTAVLKARPELVSDWQSRAWSKFFCLSVYVTMYLNDNQRSPFYESLGLDTRQFNRCAPLLTPPFAVQVLLHHSPALFWECFLERDSPPSGQVYCIGPSWVWRVSKQVQGLCP